MPSLFGKLFRERRRTTDRFLFNYMPSVATFREVCYGHRFTTTHNDRVLMEVETLLKQHKKLKKTFQRHGDDHRLALIHNTGLIYQTAGHWINKNTPPDEKNGPRLPAMLALSEIAERVLRILMRTDDMFEMGRRLKEMMVRPMSDDGIRTDQRTIDNPDTDLAQLTRDEREAHRILFRGGKGYKQLYAGGAVTGEELFDTVQDPRWINDNNAFTMANEMAGGRGLSGYAITYDRKLYCARHAGRTDRELFFHSAYTSSAPVLCAGAIGFDNGNVFYINNLSGHYKPTAKHLVFALEVLRMYGVNLSRVKVEVQSDCVVPEDPRRPIPRTEYMQNYKFPDAPSFMHAMRGA